MQEAEKSELLKFFRKDFDTDVQHRVLDRPPVVRFGPALIDSYHADLITTGVRQSVSENFRKLEESCWTLILQKFVRPDDWTESDDICRHSLLRNPKFRSKAISLSMRHHVLTS